jgi:hypothetical protein
MVPLRFRKLLEGLRELVQAGRCIRLVEIQSSLQFTNQLMPFNMLSLEIGDCIIHFVSSHSQLAEHVFVFLRMMQGLWEGFDVVQHRS